MAKKHLKYTHYNTFIKLIESGPEGMAAKYYYKKGLPNINNIKVLLMSALVTL